MYTQSHRINQMTERFSHFILKPVSSLRFGLFCTKFLLKIDRYWMATRRCTSFWTFSMRDSFYFIQYFINESIDCKSFGIDSVRLVFGKEKKIKLRSLHEKCRYLSKKKIVFLSRRCWCHCRSLLQSKPQHKPRYE